MEGQEIVTNEVIRMPGAARTSRTRPRFADLLAGGLIVALAIGGLMI